MTIGSTVEYLKTFTRLARRELRSRGAAGSFDCERVMVERQGLRAPPGRLAAYLEATEGTTIRWQRGAGAVLPPAFATAWEAGLALELLCHPRAPSVRHGVVHVASELVQVRALSADGVFRCRLELERVERDHRGTRLHLLTRTWNGGGQLGWECRTVLLARAAASAGGRGGTVAAVPSGEDWAELGSWKLGANRGRRYAAASGDFNPIHLWRLTALPFGFRRPVLHGFCMLAMVAHTAIERRFAGEPERLRRLRIAFRAPLLLPCRLRLLTSPACVGGFRLLDGKERLIADGEFAGA